VGVRELKVLFNILILFQIILNKYDLSAANLV